MTLPQFRKLVRTIQSIALTLNRHYPARLHRLFLVDAPAIVHLPVRVRCAALHAANFGAPLAAALPAAGCAAALAAAVP